MDTNKILREIVAGAQDVSLVRRAGQELRREEHNPETIWRIIRQALQDPGATYSSDAISAMREYDNKMTDAKPENRTVTVRFRCTENQRRIIQMLADREGKTISEFIRDRCLET